MTSPKPPELPDETIDKLNASLALLKYHRAALEKLVTRHSVNDFETALEFMLKSLHTEREMTGEVEDRAAADKAYFEQASPPPPPPPPPKRVIREGIGIINPEPEKKK